MQLSTTAPEISLPRWLWWKFHGAWCKPFGHVLYYPDRSLGYWQCACGDNAMGCRGCPPPWWTFRSHWREMRRASIDCPREKSLHEVLWAQLRDEWNVDRGTPMQRESDMTFAVLHAAHHTCPDCHGRRWVRP